LPMATTRNRARRATSSQPATPVSPLPGLVQAALDDMKAVNIKVMDVRSLTDITDTMIIASGNSDRHVRSIADRVVQSAKAAGFRPFGVEGARDGEWALVDLHDVIVHVMLPRVREFYGLERLWDSPHEPVAPSGTPKVTAAPRTGVKRKRTTAAAPRKRTRTRTPKA
jgi:ribosome-associated protein